VTAPAPNKLTDWLDRHADVPALQPLLQALRGHAGPVPAMVWPVIESLELLRADAEVQLAAILHQLTPLPAPWPALVAKSPGLQQLLDGLQAAEQVWSLHAQHEGRGNAEGLRRLLLALIRDLRVVLILLSEQLARLRAVAKAPEPERKALAQLTADIHAPLANRMGIWQLKWEL
jgi:GTP pyrophosphokinase